MTKNATQTADNALEGWHEISNIPRYQIVKITNKMKANVKLLVEELANVIHNMLDERIVSKSIDKVTKKSLIKIAKKVIDVERKEIRNKKKSIRKAEIKIKQLDKKVALKLRQSAVKKISEDIIAMDGKLPKPVPASQSIK